MVKSLKLKRAWAVRPYPNNIYRMKEFREQGIAAIGWPGLGDLSGMEWDDIETRLDEEEYTKGKSPQGIGQTVGIIDRFVNQIKKGHAVVVPDAGEVYVGTVTSEYHFEPKAESDDTGYSHQIGVTYSFNGMPIPRSELPATLFDSLKGRQSVFAVPADAVQDVLNDPGRYRPISVGPADQQLRAEYASRLARGQVPGVNSAAFEEAVRKVLNIYFPGLTRQPTTNAPVGADTDLKATLPGDITVRVQVKCYQSSKGALTKAAVKQVRDSMAEGEHGIVVTTNQVGDDALKAAAANPSKPVSLIDGVGFAELVFDSLERLTDEDLYSLGLRRTVLMR